MINPKIEQHRRAKADDLSDRIYFKAYNNFAVLVEKAYSPRFAEFAGDIGLNVVEEAEQGSAKGKGESRKGKAPAFTRQNFIADLKTASYRRGKSKPSPKSP